MSVQSTDVVNEFDETLRIFKRSHHSRCFFENYAPVENLQFCFSTDGILKGEFECFEKHQGYDCIVHGGIIATIIDASMAQCCMGHGIVAYTADLSIRYRNPLKIHTPTRIETRIVNRTAGVLFSLECKMNQNATVCVEAIGRFFKIPANVGSEAK